jgi:hypothetical protein
MFLIAFTGSSAERRQLSAVKKERDQEYEVQVDLNRKPSKGAAQPKYPAVLRLDPSWWLHTFY